MNNNRGFTLLEMTIVVCMIAILMTIWLHYSGNVINKAERAALESMSRNFAQATSSLRGIWVLQDGQNPVMFDQQAIYVNQFGWATGTSRPAGNGPQSAEGCRQVWDALFQNPAPARLLAEQYEPARYVISTPAADVCRYALDENMDQPAYFDYNLTTGKITLSGYLTGVN